MPASTANAIHQTIGKDGKAAKGSAYPAWKSKGKGKSFQDQWGKDQWGRESEQWGNDPWRPSRDEPVEERTEYTSRIEKRYQWTHAAMRASAAPDGSCFTRKPGDKRNDIELLSLSSVREALSAANCHLVRRQRRFQHAPSSLQTTGIFQAA